MKNKTFSVISITSLLAIAIVIAIYFMTFDQPLMPAEKPLPNGSRITCIQALYIDEYTENTHIALSDFTDLEKVDATRLKNLTKVGIFNDLTFTKHSPYEIAEFLLETKQIETYWHLNSNLCLANEVETAEIYVASFNASHEYCTNECLSEDYKFDFIIDKRTGEISVSSHDNRLNSS